MRTKRTLHSAVLFLAAISIILPLRLAAQSTGRVEFTARVAPSGGQPEPVRQLPFYLLSKSLEDIHAEAMQMAPAPDLDKFIEGLDASPELKTWMRKNHSVQLSGEDFTKKLTPDEILNIPEFFKAYMEHNAAFRGIGFPEPKYKEKDRTANPEKYQAQKKAYEDGIRIFIAGSPDSVKGMDLELVVSNPYPKWASLERKHREALDASALRLAEERYVIARTDTDLEGHGSFAGLAPGNYWISSFGADAVSGDVRQQWDFRVTVRQGEIAHAELSNFNAVRPSATAQNSIN